MGTVSSASSSQAAMDLALSVCLYGGLAGIVGWLCGRALPRLRRHSGYVRVARLAGAVGAVSAALPLAVPGREQTVAASSMVLDTASPRWQYRERHEILVRATPGVVSRAVKETTADEIAGFQFLTAVRRFGRPGPENILHAPGRLPLLDVATRTTFRLLADTPDEVVIGTLVAGAGRAVVPANVSDFAALDSTPGLAKATMNFRLMPEGNWTRVTTETRVFATDAATRRTFGWYWRAIYPGSAMIRVAWLRAIRARAERQP